MSARKAGGWLFGAVMMAAWPLSAALASGEPDLAPPDVPAAIVLDVAERVVGLAIDLPDPPEVVVEIQAAQAAPTEAAPAEVASTEAAPPEPASAIRTGSVPEAPAAAPVVVTATDLLTGALETRLADPKLPLPPRLSRRDREALAAHYAANRFRPAWIRDGTWTEAWRAIANRLARADEDGLDPADYPVPSLAGGVAPLTPAELAEAELKLSATAFLYARDARGGRIDPARISALITPKLAIPTLDAVLSRLVASPDPDAALLAFQPAYPGYRALREALSSIRANRPAGPLVRAQARAGPALAAADPAAPAASGTGRVASPRLEGDIVANMERWRWLPAELAQRFVAVNVPEYRLRLVEDGRVTHETRVIAGRASTPTPIFSGLMDHAIVNPSWFIPPSILRNEILPGLQKDPEYASRRGYEVVRRGKSVSVRQPPGPKNALGYVKFMFPNDHAVYLHDTPNRSLFGQSARALSHGCIRVEQPFAFGARILGASWTEERLRKLIGSGERMITLPEKMPVHLTYFTVSVDAAGEVRTFDDIYGHNRRIRAALGLGA